MNKPLFSAFAGLMAHIEFGSPDGTTHFSKLSGASRRVELIRNNLVTYHNEEP